MEKKNGETWQSGQGGTAGWEWTGTLKKIHSNLKSNKKNLFEMVLKMLKSSKCAWKL